MEMAGLTMKIKLKGASSKYRDLTPGNVYRVIGIEADDYRVMNDHGQPFLYPRRLFVVLNADEPQDWITSIGDEGERYAYPKALSAPGFFEDYFDGNRAAWRTLHNYLENPKVFAYRPKARAAC